MNRLGEFAGVGEIGGLRLIQRMSANGVAASDLAIA